MKSQRLEKKTEGGGSYFTAPTYDLEFIPAGCKLLDLVLGGGWAEGRVINIVGDKSSGKTLMVIEASANFAVKYPKGLIFYREAEAAFLRSYAEMLGMPLDRVDFGKDKVFDTVEYVFEDMETCIERCMKKKVPGLYILDSLDALSDSAELKRDMDEPSYGTEKARKMSQFFRRLVRKMERAQITVIIVSQVRSKIGSSFGRTTTRSGGRALDFYASQVLYLAHLGTITRIVKGIKRPVGVHIKAKCDKNKVALPYRECVFDILFAYGVDDLSASVEWLHEVKALGLVGLKRKGPKGIKSFLKATNKLSDKDYEKELVRINAAVHKKWYAIEKTFLPTRRKYRSSKEGN